MSSSTEKKKTQDDSNSGTKTKTVVVIKQLFSSPLDELNDEERSLYKGHVDSYPTATWSLLTWDGTLEGFSLISRLHHDAAKDGTAAKDYGFGTGGLLPYPPGFGSITGNTLATWEAKLFFAGGEPFHTPNPSRKLVSFDTGTRQWNYNDLPSMEIARSFHSAVALNGSIYIFGDCITSKERIPQKSWAQRFDIKAERWYDDLGPPSDLAYSYYQPTASAVFRNCPSFKYTTKNDCQHKVEQNQNLILLLHDDSHAPISVFNCNTNCWLPDMYPPNPTIARDFPFCPRHEFYQDRLAVLDSHLIWHCFGQFFAYDLVNQVGLRFPFSRTRITGAPAFLFPQGDDKLLILSQTTRNPYSIDCRVFQVQTKSQGHASFQLRCLGCRCISTGDQLMIYDAHTIHDREI